MPTPVITSLIQYDTGQFENAAGLLSVKNGGLALAKLAEAVLQADGDQALTADWDVGGFKLQNLGAPSSGTDAATKTYADNLATGIRWKAPLLNVAQFASSVSGALKAGNFVSIADYSTLTGAMTIKINDGTLYTLIEGTDWDAETSEQVTAENIRDAINGIAANVTAVVKTYTNGVSDVVIYADTAGVAGNAFTLEISAHNGMGIGEFSSDTGIWNYRFSGKEDTAIVFAQGLASSVENDARFVKNDDSAWTYDQDEDVWVQFSGAGQLTEGNGINISGNLVSIDPTDAAIFSATPDPDKVVKYDGTGKLDASAVDHTGLNGMGAENHRKSVTINTTVAGLDGNDEINLGETPVSAASIKMNYGGVPQNSDQFTYPGPVGGANYIKVDATIAAGGATDPIQVHAECKGGHTTD